MDLRFRIEAKTKRKCNQERRICFLVFLSILSSQELPQHLKNYIFSLIFMTTFTPESWYEYANRFVPASSVGTFKALFAGMDCYDMSYFWNKYLAGTEFERKDLLMATGFASGYDKNWRSYASRWSVGHNQMEDRVWNILEYLGPELNEVKSFKMNALPSIIFQSPFSIFFCYVLLHFQSLVQL